jgi:hypothetical protein
MRADATWRAPPPPVVVEELCRAVTRSSACRRPAGEKAIRSLIWGRPPSADPHLRVPVNPVRTLCETCFPSLHPPAGGFLVMGSRRIAFPTLVLLAPGEKTLGDRTLALLLLDELTYDEGGHSRRDQTQSRSCFWTSLYL